MNAAEHLQGLAQAGRSYRELLEKLPLDLAVPTCPSWDVRDLTGHLGYVHRWASGAIEHGHPDTPVPPVPDSQAGLLDYFDAGLAGLTALLESVDPEQPCWTFGPRPRLAGFWFGRQHHETAMHAVDLMLAAGQSPSYAGGAAAAADGLDEVVGMFLPRQLARGRVAAWPSVVRLEATDLDRSWVLAADAESAEGAESAEPDAAVRAEALDLLLAVWHRRPELLDVPGAVSGDAAAAREVLGLALTP